MSCGHEYERHLFGGMCFYCDCKKAKYNTDELVFLKKHDPEEHENGSSPDRKKSRGPGRLGNK